MRNCIHACMEGLEPRRFLAGNVTAVVTAESLVLAGDALDNSVSIEQSEPGTFIVSGGFSNTTINGGTDPLTFTGVRRDVRFAAGGGLDSLSLQHSDFFSPVAIGRDLVVSGASGAANEVFIFANTPLDVGRDFSYTGGSDSDRTGLFGTVHVGRHVSFTNRGGNNTTDMSAFFEASTVGGDLTISNGNGTHSNFVVDTSVGGNVSFVNGDAPADFGETRNTFGLSSGFENPTVGGNLSFITGSGASESDLAETNVSGDVNILAGGEASIEVGSFSPSSAMFIDGDLNITAAGPAEVSAGGVGFRRAGTLAVGGSLNIGTGGSEDVVTLNLLSVIGSSTVATGSGADEVVIDDSTFAGFTLSTGGGDDALRLESISGPEIEGPATVFRSLSANLGAGDDHLQIGVAGDPNRRVELLQSSQFSGGSGNDLRDAANVQGPATYTGFEQDAPPPLLLGPRRFAADEYVVAVVTADFNNDGVLDIATTNQDARTTSILLGNGDGTFAAPTNFAAGTTPSGLVAADFNNDGNLDLAWANNSSARTVSVRLGNGDGSFGARTTRLVSPNLRASQDVTAGDVNGDGLTDLVSINRTLFFTTETTASVFLSNGDGTFQAAVEVGLGAGNGLNGTQVTLGDVNGDATLDIVAATTSRIVTLLGTGTGTFGAPVARAHSPISSGLELADLNGDSLLDLVTAGNSLTVLLGNGDGTFNDETEIVDAGITGMALGDITGDGRLDIVAGHFASPGDILAVIPGNGDGTFAAPLHFSPGPDDGPVALGDVDGDGLLDVIMGNQEFGSVAVFLNNSDAA